MKTLTSGLSRMFSRKEEASIRAYFDPAQKGFRFLG
jgi:hypothetical protein